MEIQETVVNDFL